MIHSQIKDNSYAPALVLVYVKISCWKSVLAHLGVITYELTANKSCPSKLVYVTYLCYVL